MDGPIKWYLTEKKLEQVLENQRFEPERGYRIVDTLERKIFIKSFREKGLFGHLRNLFSPRGKKEFEIFNTLKSLSIETPVSFGYGVSSWGSFSVWEYISAESYLKTFSGAEDRIPLLKMLASFLNKLKEKGVRHDDLHLENLIFFNNRLILVDLHKVKIKKKLKKEDEISNLSHALSMIYDSLNEREKEAFFEFYGAPLLKASVERKLEILRRRWIKRKIKRAFRETSVVSVIDDYRFIKGYERVKEGEFILRLKKDKKVEVFRYRGCVKKVYKNRARLKRAWANSVVLNYMGFQLTPQVFGVKLPKVFSRGFILMEDLSKKGEELDRYLDGRFEKIGYSSKVLFIKAFSRFFARMINHGVYHKDLKGCNIFVTEDMKFYLLDIEDIQFRKLTQNDVVSMLAKLNNTIPKKISLRDRLKFLAFLDIFSKGERKEIWKRVSERARTGEIVYEGKSGLRRERWGN